MHRCVGQAIGSVTLAGFCLTSLACERRSHVAYKDLDDDDPFMRAEAATRLGEARSHDAVDSLIVKLDDPDPRVRRSVVLALGEIGDPRAVPALMDRSDDRVVREALCRALGQLADARAIPLLVRLLDEMDHPVRLAAAQGLAMIPGRESTEALVHVVLRDESEAIRAEATKLLEGMDETLALQIVQQAAQDGDDEERANAVRLLGHVGNRASLEVLLHALEDGFYRVRCQAAHALAQLAPDAPEVKEALGRRMEVETHELAQVDLAWSLVQLGDASHLERIRTLLVQGSPEQVRAEAAAALGDVGDDSDLPRLTRALEGDDMGIVRREAYVAIQKLKKG